jgi:hypothetical protein
MVKAREAKCGQKQWKYHHQRDRHPDRGNGADGKEQRDHIEPDEAALLIFVVNDIERVKDGFHAGIGAPQRNAEP